MADFTQYELAWPAQHSMSYDDSHSVAVDEVVVWHFKTPDTLGTGQGSIELVEYNSAPAARTGALNYIAGDLYTLIGPANNTGGFDNDTAPNVFFFGALPSGKHVNPANYLVLKPATDYYFNVSNSLGQEGQVKVTLTNHKM